MPRPFFAFVRHPADIAELPRYMSDYKWLFHDANEEYEFAHTLERPGQRGYWLANLCGKVLFYAWRTFEVFK
jgi:hypothetical protein